MKLDRVFQAVEETQFLKQLSSQDRIFFIGETEILEYIKSFFQENKHSDYSSSSTRDRNDYYDLSTGDLNDLSAISPIINQYQAIIVASFKDEAILFSEVKQKITELKLSIPTLRLFADVFINLVSKRRLLQSSSDLVVKPQISYAILTTPRSGSTHLCNLLDSTGIAGYPTEHLRMAAQELAGNCNFDYLRLLYNVMQYRTSNNGVFGTKFISHFLFQLKQTKYDFPTIFQPFDKFILLSRKNKVAQAVSLVIAQKTEVWHLSKNASKNETGYQAYQSKLENIDIDDALLAEVEKKRQFLIEQEARLNKILLANQKQPLQVIYEDIVEDPQSEIGRILNFLDITKLESCPIAIKSQVKKMPSKISQKIINRFEQRRSTV